MRRTIVGSVAMLLTGAACATSNVSLPAAESPPAVTSGAFVTTLGTDTIAVERYTRSPTRLEGEVLSRFQGARRVHYVAELLPDARVRSVAYAQTRLGADSGAPAVLTSTMMENGTATVSVQRAGRPDTAAGGMRTYAGAAIPRFPGFPSSAAIYEQMLRLARFSGTDSVQVVLVSPGRQPLSSVWITRNPSGELVYRSTFLPGWTEQVTVDENGLIRSIDASGTTVGTVTRRAANLDFEAIRRAWTSLAAGGQITAQASPPDTVRATVGAARLEIAYSRPFRRGRTIFGSPVVPWGRVWRTGANAATQLTTSRDLMFGATRVPAGKYTLFTLPSPEDAKLIINRQTGQWGTDYDPSRDLARIDMNSRTLTEPVEQFTISVEPVGRGGTLRLAWDRTEYSIPFTVR